MSGSAPTHAGPDKGHRHGCMQGSPPHMTAIVGMFASISVAHGSALVGSWTMGRGCRVAMIAGGESDGWCA